MAKKPEEVNHGRTEKDYNSHPDSKYPLNEVTQYRGGMKIVVGNEEGKQKYEIHHPGGAVFQIGPDGSFTQAAAGGMKQTIGGSVTVSIDENNDVHVKGHNKIQVAGGQHVEIAGNSDTTVGKGMTINVVGGGAIINVNGNAKIQAEGQMNLDAGSMNIRSKGDMSLGSDGTIFVQASAIKMQPNGDGSPGYRGAPDGTGNLGGTTT